MKCSECDKQLNESNYKINYLFSLLVFALIGIIATGLFLWAGSDLKSVSWVDQVYEGRAKSFGKFGGIVLMTLALSGIILVTGYQWIRKSVLHRQLKGN